MTQGVRGQKSQPDLSAALTLSLSVLLASLYHIPREPGCLEHEGKEGDVGEWDVEEEEGLAHPVIEDGRNITGGRRGFGANHNPITGLVKRHAGHKNSREVT